MLEGQLPPGARGCGSWALPNRQSSTLPSSSSRLQVWVSEPEVEDIAKHLGMPVGAFSRRFTKSYRKYDGWRLLKNKLTNVRP